MTVDATAAQAGHREEGGSRVVAVAAVVEEVDLAG